jgi:acetyltransferase-like isoleucine patch superfamily enzyme
MSINRDHAFGSGPSLGKPSAFEKLFRRGWSGEAKARLKMIGAWRQFSRFAQIANSCRLGPDAWCVNCKGEPHRITLGEKVICRGLLRVEQFGDGRIDIGDNVYIGDDCLVSCAQSVRIGRHTLLAHGVHIFDNDTHPLDWQQRAADVQAILRGKPQQKPPIPSAPVEIGEHAWIGFNSVIMKGVTIGARSVVAAASVITRDVPPDTLVAGNPPRVIRSLTGAEQTVEV